MLSPMQGIAALVIALSQSITGWMTPEITTKHQDLAPPEAKEMIDIQWVQKYCPNKYSATATP